MFKKFDILIILLLLAITVSAVSAADDGNATLGNEDNLDVVEVSDVSDEVSSSEYTVTEGDYGTYFENNGTLKENINSGDTIKLSGSFSNKNFIFNKQINLVGEDSNKISNSMFTFLNGSSGSSISNLNINNHVNETYGIFLNGASNCVITGCTIINQGKSSYPICLGNGANYNRVADNFLQTSGEDYGHGSRSTPTLLISGSHYNHVKCNKIEVEDANAIYLSSYSGGPLIGGDSNNNIIFNNTIHYNVLPTSWSYAIQVMGSSNEIKSNKIIGAYRGVTTTGVNNKIIGNWIINLTGADYNNKQVEIGGEYAIVGSTNSNVSDNHIVNAKIISTGAAISVIDGSVVENNYIDVKSVGMGISAAGYNVVIKNNNISTVSGVGVYEKDDGSGLTITGNNISSVSGIGILIEKISSKRLPSNVTITYNDIVTSAEYAIDASGVLEGTSVIDETNNVHGKKIKSPSGVYDDSLPTYKYNESKTYTVNPSNFNQFINDNGNLIGDVEDGVILKFEGTFSNKVIYINKKIKIIGNGATFLNSTFKLTSGSVWIENLTIINKNAERLNAWGIYLNEVAGAKIINNTIKVSDPNAAYAIYVLESSYVDIINNTLFSDGDFLTYTVLLYSSESCNIKNNDITTVGTGQKYRFSPESSIEGKTYTINGTEVCIDGSVICIDGVTYCLDGNEVCIDGVTYCLDGDVLIIKQYVINETNEVCIDGVTYCLDGNEFVSGENRYPVSDNKVCIDGVTYCIDGNVMIPESLVYQINETSNEVCIDGVTYCLDGNEFVSGENRYAITDNRVCIDGVTYCLDGNVLTVEKYTINETTNEVCIDGVTYCLDGNELVSGDTRYTIYEGKVCIDGVTYCLDGNELVVNGTTYGRTNHMVPEIYRTYGILLLYSSMNQISENDVNVTSKLEQVAPTSGSNASENSIVGIDIYYNSHNNTVSSNNVYVSGNDNFLYGVGVLGSKSGHTAPAGQGASNNSFIGNEITLVGPYSTTGIIIGGSSEDTLIANNSANASSKITYGITLEESSDSTIQGNDLTLNSDLAYGIEGFKSNNNLIEDNNIKANGKQVYGLALSGNNNEIMGNDILANGTGEELSFPARDSFGSGNAGVYLSGNATNNIIKSNNITSQSGFAIVSDAGGNTIEDNLLKSEKGNSNAAINATDGNTIKSNYIYTVVGAIEDTEIPYMGSGDIVLNVQSPDGTSLDGATVCFYDDFDINIGNCTVYDGKAILNYQLDESYSSVNAQYHIKAVFIKDDFKLTTFETNNLYVSKGNLNVVVSDVSVNCGVAAKFTATVTNGLGKPVSGLTVKFYNYDTGNQQAWGTATTDSNGVATISYFIDNDFETDFGKITNVTASVLESDYYLASNGKGLLTIKEIVPITIQIKTKTGFSGVFATITDNDGNAVANKVVRVTIDGVSQNLKTNSNGELTLPAARAGTHNVVVSSAKDSFYEAGSGSGAINVVASISGNKNAKVYFGNTVAYKIRIADKNGNYLGANQVVTITVNNKLINLKTDANGYVTYKVKKVGTYTITATYNGYKVSNKIVIKPTLISKNIVKKKAKKIKFTVKLVNKKGKILKKKKVTFKIKGKKYKVKTNKKGVAKLYLKNLKAGKYTISSSYGGCTVKNTIKVKK